MKITVDIVGSLSRMMEAEILAGERAVTRGVSTGGAQLQKDWRGQVTSSGLGQRLARTIRKVDYPKGDVSLNAASLVYARPNARPVGASAAVVIQAHDEGSVIRGKEGLWLAIPLGEVAKRRGPRNSRITPLGWEQGTQRALTFIYRRGRFPLLVDTGTPLQRRPSDPMAFSQSPSRTRKNVWIPIFVLGPVVRLKKRLNLEKLARAAEASLPGLITSFWKVPD